MGHNEIIKRSAEIFTATFTDGSEAIVIRRKRGFGYTIKHIQDGNKPLWCVDYDENGCVECEYPEY